MFGLEVDVLSDDDTGVAVSAWRRFLLAPAVILSQNGAN